MRKIRILEVIKRGMGRKMLETIVWDAEKGSSL